MEWISLIIYFGIIGVVSIMILLISALLGPRKRIPGKLSPYECGMELLMGARENFSIKYYIIALIFILFDIEILFLIPWAVNIKFLGIAGFVEMVIFLIVLGAGLFYVVKRGAFRWD
jgi:NADH-quinone oxidoreductase subunit A